MNYFAWALLRGLPLPGTMPLGTMPLGTMLLGTTLLAWGCNKPVPSPNMAATDAGDPIISADESNRVGDGRAVPLGDAAAVDAAISDARVPETPADGCASRVATGTAPVIDNFTETGLLLPGDDNRQGAWFGYDDGTSGSFSMEENVNPEGGALVVQASGWTGWGAGFGFMVGGGTETLACVYDAAAYGGLELTASGSGRLKVRLQTRQNTPLAEGGQCDRPGENCYDWPSTWVNLTPEAQTYRLPFCLFEPEGWGGEKIELEPSQLVGVHFQTDGGARLDFRLERISFIPPGSEGEMCERACPLDKVQSGTMPVPDSSRTPLSEELTLHTFEQETTTCGVITRRYLSYVSNNLPKKSDAPVLVALHGSGADAESFQLEMTRGGLDELAEAEGFIVVYGNAAPGAYTTTYLNNGGAWRQDYFDDGEVDDVDYLERVLLDLQDREVIAGDNPLFLTGISNGGGMAIEAAKRMRERVSGIAAFMYFDGFEPSPVPSLEETELTRALFAYSVGDPGVPADYHEIASKVPEQWAQAMGIAETLIEAPPTTAIDNLVDEGQDYQGDAPIPLATRNSTVERRTMSTADGKRHVDVLVFDGAGHLWPHPTQDTDVWMLDRWGFRNQDVDASQVVWEFFKDGL